MKNGWQTKMLGDVCSFENGDRGTNYPSRSAQTSHGIPFINAGHLTDEGIDIENLNFIPRERFDLLSNGKIRRGDILFCLRGSLGKFASVGSLSQGAIASSLVIVRPGESVLGGYMLAYFQSDLCADMIGRFRNGAAQPNLSAQSLTKFTIPVPPLPEQQQIVGILDEAFEGITTAKANAEKNHQNAHAIFESHLQSVFTRHGAGRKTRKLGDVLEVQNGYAFDSKAFNPSKGMPLIRIRSLKAGTETETRFTGDYDEKYVVKAGDLLIGMDGEFGCYEWKGSPALLNQRVCRLQRFTSGLVPRFLFYGVNSYLKAIEDVTGYATVKHLSSKQILDIEFPFPSVAEQKRFVTTLDSLREETQHLATLYERKLAALEALKKSLLHQAFNGQLTRDN